MWSHRQDHRDLMQGSGTYRFPITSSMNTHHLDSAVLPGVAALLVQFEHRHALHSTFLSEPRNLFQIASRLLSLLDLDIFNNQFNASNNLPLSFDIGFYSHFKTWIEHLFSLVELGDIFRQNLSNIK